MHYSARVVGNLHAIDPQIIQTVYYYSVHPWHCHGVWCRTI